MLHMHCDRMRTKNKIPAGTCVLDQVQGAQALQNHLRTLTHDVVLAGTRCCPVTGWRRVLDRAFDDQHGDLHAATGATGTDVQSHSNDNFTPYGQMIQASADAPCLS